MSVMQLRSNLFIIIDNHNPFSFYVSVSEPIYQSLFSIENMYCMSIQLQKRDETNDAQCQI